MGERTFVKGGSSSQRSSRRPRRGLLASLGLVKGSPQKKTSRRRYLEDRSIAQKASPVENVEPVKNTAGQRRDSSPVKKSGTPRRSVRLRIDVGLLLVISTLVIFGLLMVFSASWTYSLDSREYAMYGGRDPSLVLQRQAMFLALGCVVAAVLALLDYHIWQKLAVWGMLGIIGLLVIVLFVNDERHGAVRSLFSGSVQPSEAAKLMVIIYLAVWLYAKRDQLKDLSLGFLPLSVIIGFMAGLILLQPDLSAVATIAVLGVALFFLGGGELRQTLLFVGIGIVVGLLVVQFSDTGRLRMETYIDGLRDPMNASYHVQRSIEAFMRGGLFGVGLGNSITKLTGLPVPHTDSIFAVIGEEWGILGSSFLVTCYALLLWRGLVIARRAPDGLGSLLAIGISMWLVMEAFINMAVLVGLVPVTGNALPFISAGGSSLVVSLAGVGILFSVSRFSEQTIDMEERSFSEVVNLRRRDWRGRESRSRRTSSQRVRG